VTGNGGQNVDIATVTARTALGLLLRAPDSYGLVLFLLIVGFVLSPLVQGVTWLWVRVLVVGATMLFALHTSRVGKRTMRLASALFGISLLLALASSASGGGKPSEGTIELLLALLLAICIPATLRRILTAGKVGLEVILGALDVYIIFGLLFSAVYSAIGAFSSTPFFANHPQVGDGDYQFFSFVTLTTVGYGNLVPDLQIGQSLAVLEALFGQVYLVTLVARLVTGYQPGVHHRAADRIRMEREEHADGRGDERSGQTDASPTAAEPSSAGE
jgi:hypothetical protein